MRGQTVHLDSNAIVKRYIKEPSSNYVREIYLKCYSGDLTIAFSIWNIGEVLGVLDKARITGRLDEEAYSITRRRLLLETRRMIKLGILSIIPLRIENPQRKLETNREIPHLRG